MLVSDLTTAKLRPRETPVRGSWEANDIMAESSAFGGIVRGRVIGISTGMAIGFPAFGAVILGPLGDKFGRPSPLVLSWDLSLGRGLRDGYRARPQS